jgi:hypothetical protein
MIKERESRERERVFTLGVDDTPRSAADIDPTGYP